MLGSAKLPRMVRVSAPRTSLISCMTLPFAVAVVASTRRFGGNWGNTFCSRRYCGRKSCPQSEMQCASSMTSIPIRLNKTGPILSRNHGFSNRSGETSKTSTESDFTSSSTVSQSGLLVESMIDVLTPILEADST